MRTALLSDIHGNLVALEAVLADLSRLSPDAIICLGDVAVTGPQPRQVLARLRCLGWPIVMGNTDAWLPDPQPWNVSDEDSSRLLALEQWGASMMEPEDLFQIRSFQPTIEMSVDPNQVLLCFHGSPCSNTDLIEPGITEDELIEKLADHRATVLAGDHTHRQMMIRFEECFIINSGSVGLLIETIDGQTHNPCWAEYALINSHKDGLRIAFRRVPVDLADLTAAVRASDMPHPDWWLEGWH